MAARTVGRSPPSPNTPQNLQVWHQKGEGPTGDLTLGLKTAELGLE